MKKMDYKKSGVDVQKATQLVEWMKKKTSISLGSLGNDYASLYPFSCSQYKHPVLAGTTDGVGSKVKLAAYYQEWEGIGQDLVAMCVNDLICTGAKPLFFLDYYASGRLKAKSFKAFLKGLERACKLASCPLLGGETAELPGLYTGQDMDCAGFCLGVVERSKILRASRVRAGDDIVAFKSSGFHSNGYSLLRKIYSSSSSLKQNRKTLMRPTRLYTFLSPSLDQIRGLRAMAHITGGGLDNISRILPKGMVAELKPWSIPSCFLDVQQKAGLTWKNLLQTFNCGLGLVVIIKNKQTLFSDFPSEDIVDLGKVVKTKKSFQPWKLNFSSLKQRNS